MYVEVKFQKITNIFLVRSMGFIFTEDAIKLFGVRYLSESQDSGFYATKTALEENAQAMVKQTERNQISNAFDYFQALIEELKNQWSGKPRLWPRKFNKPRTLWKVGTMITITSEALGNNLESFF